MDNNFLFLCVLQVTLADESIVLYMCKGKVLMDIQFSCLIIQVCKQSWVVQVMWHKRPGKSKSLLVSRSDMRKRQVLKSENL